ncbi:MAG TPA: DNA translocase FtsK, partial [Limnochordia bacterium]
MDPAAPSAARPPGRRTEITGIILIALAALALVSLHSRAAGLFGAWTAFGLRWCLGWTADVVPLFAFAAGFMCLFLRRQLGSSPGARAAGALLVFGTLIVAADLVGPPVDHQTPAAPAWVLEWLGIAASTLESGPAGGRLGAWLSALCRAAFGVTGTWIVLAGAAGTGAVLALDTPVSPYAVAGGRWLWRALRGLATAVWALIHALGEIAVGAVREIRDLFRLGRDRWALARQARAARRAERRKAARGDKLGPGVRRLVPAGQDAATEGGTEPAPARAQARPLAVPAASSEPERAGDDPETAAPAGASRPARQPARPEQLDLPAAERVYRLPPLALLSRPRERRRSKAPQPVDQSPALEETLRSFGVEAKVVRVSRGPVITRYELQPAPGVKVSRIVGLADDLALAMAAPDVRIEAPVPGKSVVGIEVPNKETSTVYLREVLESEAFTSNRSHLLIGFGKDIAGNPVVADLPRLLHLLIAGATGSGKSICINAIIASLLYRAMPDELKLLMIDPKRVELSTYDGIPHLIAPVVTDPKQAAGALRWAVKEMERRYRLLSEAKARNIDAYNRSVLRGELEGESERLPYLAVIIDELADLMLVAQHEVEDSICRLAQMARAAGIHLIIATQRPSVDVITGLIKANVPSRIAFAVSSSVDSRTILDMAGAERLLGKGDMLFHPYGAGKPVRAQGAWISDKEVQALVDFWKAQGQPEFEEAVLQIEQGDHAALDVDDELFDDAVRLVVERGQASVSMLQRRFRIGYARAGRLIEMMEERGIVGPAQ